MEKSDVYKLMSEGKRILSFLRTGLYFDLGQGNYGGSRSLLDTEIFYQGELIGIVQDAVDKLSLGFNFV